MYTQITYPDEIPSEGKMMILCVSDTDWFGMFLKPIFEKFVQSFPTLDARTIIITSKKSESFCKKYPALSCKPYILFFFNGWCYTERRDVDKLTLIEVVNDFVNELENLKIDGFYQIQW
jgi:hypothetical protein